jgi:hypothetical protein
MQDQEHVLNISKREGAEHDWKEEEKNQTWNLPLRVTKGWEK